MNNIIFANFNTRICRKSKLPKSLTTTIPTLEGKFDRFELFGNLFQTRLKVPKQLAEDDKSKNFHTLKRDDALQKFKHISSPTRMNVGDILKLLKWKTLHVSINHTVQLQGSIKYQTPKICFFFLVKLCNCNRVIAYSSFCCQNVDNNFLATKQYQFVTSVWSCCRDFFPFTRVWSS